MNNNSYYMLMLLGLTALYFVPFWYLRRRRRVGKKIDITEGETIGSLDDLARAEQEAMIGESRQTALLATHELYDRFPSIKSYTQSYFDQLILHLADNGVNADSIFLPSGPVGYGASIIQAQGLYELYIERENFERGAELVRKYMQR